ncbi:MAG: methyltransferase domain-containing protein [Rhodothermales bacterium]|nr:methyltransferase domain-containing protein [Rhodothermales bacterium]
MYFSSDAAYRPYFVATTIVASLGIVVFWATNLLDTRIIIIGAILFRLAFLWMPPELSDDAYRYVWDGRVTVAGYNPYLHTPEDLVEADLMLPDYVYQQMNSKSLYTVYPPVSQYLFAAGGLVEKATGSWTLAYYFLKLVFFLLEVIAVLLLSKIVSANNLLLYAWNPVVLIETAGQMHTESVLVLLLVASIWAMRHERKTLAASLLAGAVWVKLYPLFILPLLIRRLRIQNLAIAAGVGTVIALPFIQGDVAGNVASSLNLYFQSFEFNAGLYYAIKEIAFWFTGVDQSKLIGPILRSVFFGAVALLYVVDWHRDWSFPRSVLWVLGLYVVLATTVHPWYFLGILAIIPCVTANDSLAYFRVRWNWYVVAALSMGSYLLYTGHISWYWGFVVLAWVAWLGLSLIGLSGPVLDKVVRIRATRKYEWIRKYLKADYGGEVVLDLGAGEGYIGEYIHSRNNADVLLVDVVDFNKSRLPLITYDGRTLPCPDSSVSTSVLYFVLHHTRDPESVLDEVVRVTTGDIIIVESTYRSKFGRWILTWLDHLANTLRSHGQMDNQREYLSFRRDEQWLLLFHDRGLELIDVEHRGLLIHHRVLYHLRTNNLPMNADRV